MRVRTGQKKNVSPLLERALIFKFHFKNPDRWVKRKTTMAKDNEILDKAKKFALSNNLTIIPDQITGKKFALCKNVQSNGQVVERKSVFCSPKELDTLIEGYCFGQQTSKKDENHLVLHLLYEGDQWLSTSSLVLMGVFTNENDLKSGAEKLIREDANNNYTEEDKQNEKSMEDYIEESVYWLMSDRQLLGCYNSFLISDVTPNLYGEV